MNYIIKVIKLLASSIVLIDGVSETMKTQNKKQESGFLDMLLGTIGVSVLGNILTVNGAMRAGRRYINMDENF